MFTYGRVGVYSSIPTARTLIVQYKYRYNKIKKQTFLQEKKNIFFNKSVADNKIIYIFVGY